MRSLLLRSLSQKNCNFHSHDDIIKQSWVKKGPTCIPCANGDRKMKFNSKGGFKMNYYFLKLLLLLPLVMPST